MFDVRTDQWFFPDIFPSIYGYGSIPISTIFSGLFTSIYLPSYFDVNNLVATFGFDTLPYGYGSKLGTPIKLDG